MAAMDPFMESARSGSRSARSTSSTVVTSSDHGAVASTLSRCFNQAGDCKVVVIPGRSSCQKEECVEFLVWSPLLGASSEVFAAMFAHNFVERHEGRIEICDFSAAAVEAFLWFLYSGEMAVEHDTPEVLVEICALADKYAVEPLQKLCLASLSKVLNNDTACRLLEAADALEASVVRERCLRVVCDPSKALPQSFRLKPAILDRVLAAKLFDINDFGMVMMFLRWAQNPECEECGVDVASLLEKHVTMAALSEIEYREALAFAQDLASDHPKLVPKLEELWQSCPRGQYTNNLFESLWERYVQLRTEVQRNPGPRERNRPPCSFLGFWLNLIPSRASFEMPYSNAQKVRDINHRVDLFEDDVLCWMIPHHVIYISGLSFESDLRVTNRVQVFSSFEGMTWELLWDSGTHAQVKTTIPCRAKEPARWLKLCVLKGEHKNTLNIHGVFHDLALGASPLELASLGGSADLNDSSTSQL